MLHSQPSQTDGDASRPALRAADWALGRKRSIGAHLSSLLGSSRQRPRPPLSDTTHRCPLCGREFTQAEAAACPTCPIAERCGLVMCPGCGYEFPPA